MKESMKRTILLTITALCMALQVMTAQTKSNDNYKYHKALEILRGDGDPAEARKLLADNIKENPKHIDSYMLMVAIDRNEEDYASALHVLNDVVKVNYKGTLIDGTEFDSSYKRNEPTTFRANQVIKGWTEALTMMPVGSKWELYIPQELAYGARETGGQIKPFSTLIFEVELLEIEKKK